MYLSQNDYKQDQWIFFFFATNFQFSYFSLVVCPQTAAFTLSYTNKVKSCP